MLLADEQIEGAIAAGNLTIQDFESSSLQPASYDFRVGAGAFTSTSKSKVDLSRQGLVIVEPGEFAVIETRERVSLGPKIAGQLGLRSEYATRGLLMLSGPQVDPGFKGILVVRVVNLAPENIVLTYEEPFLTAQFFQLNQPVRSPYAGARQNQDGISGRDIQELTRTEGMTLGQVVKTLSVLANDVAELKGSVKSLSLWVPIIIALGIVIIGLIVGLK